MLALFAEYQSTGDRRCRDEIVRLHNGVVEHYVGKCARRGVDAQDLRQVGRLAILRAVDRFDPARGVQFSTFASRTVEGELKRYFRDKTWTVRPPRGAQDLSLAVRHTEGVLSNRLGRTPTVAELADELGETVDHVIEALEVGAAYRVASIDQPAVDGDEVATARTDRILASVELGFVHVDDELLLAGLLEHLDERERLVIQLRFFEGCTQAEMAQRAGLSQSYVSRILRRVLIDLREHLGDDRELVGA